MKGPTWCLTDNGPPRYCNSQEEEGWHYQNQWNGALDYMKGTESPEEAEPRLVCVSRRLDEIMHLITALEAQNFTPNHAAVEEDVFKGNNEIGNSSIDMVKNEMESGVSYPILTPPSSVSVEVIELKKDMEEVKSSLSKIQEGIIAISTQHSKKEASCCHGEQPIQEWFLYFEQVIMDQEKSRKRREDEFQEEMRRRLREQEDSLRTLSSRVETLATMTTSSSPPEAVKGVLPPLIRIPLTYTSKGKPIYNYHDPGVWSSDEEDEYGEFLNQENAMTIGVSQSVDANSTKEEWTSKVDDISFKVERNRKRKRKKKAKRERSRMETKRLKERVQVLEAKMVNGSKDSEEHEMQNQWKSDKKSKPPSEVKQVTSKGVVQGEISKVKGDPMDGKDPT